MLHRPVLAALAIGLVLAMGSSMAEDKEKEDVASRELTEIRKMSALLGAKVVNVDNQKTGEIADLIMDRNGKIRYGVLGHGGVLGIGDTYIPVPWTKMNLAFDKDKQHVVLKMVKEELEKAPSFKRDNYRDLTSPEWVAKVHDFFRTDAKDAANKDNALEVLRASQILKHSLTNAQNDKLGEVEDLILNRDNEVAFVILGHGGLLGIGEKYIAIPWSEVFLSYNPSDTSISPTVKTTKEKLEKAPALKQDNYADLLNPDFVKAMRGHFATEAKEKSSDK